MRDRFVEGALGAPFGGRVGGAGWTIVTTASETVHVQPGASESRVHVAGREGSEVAEGAQPEADEELDQLGRGVADISQPAHRERRQVRSRLPRCDHDMGRRIVTPARRAAIVTSARRAAIVEATRPSATPTPTGALARPSESSTPVTIAVSRAASATSPP